MSIKITSAPTSLTLLFVILKLTGVVGWSWWWVLSPIWIASLIILMLFILTAVMVLVAAWADGK